jgi:hypothetical protein
MDVAKNFGVTDESQSEITTAADLLECAAKRSRAPVGEIAKLITKAGGELSIMDKLLSVKIAPEKVAALNKQLLALGVEKRRKERMFKSAIIV